jgi:hypothetical protein
VQLPLVSLAYSSSLTLRLLTTLRVSQVPLPGLRVSADRPHSVDNAPTVIWSIFELNISLICACLPAICPLLGHYFPMIIGSTDVFLRKPWKGSLMTSPGGGNGHRDDSKRQNRLYQRFITSNKQSRAKDKIPEEDELELQQYESWI